MKISRESLILAGIGVIDLVTTIVLIRGHGAEEANPLFRKCWEMGILTFVVVKLGFLIGPLMTLEWARRRNPRFVSFALRGAIAAYIMFYGVGFLRLNGPAAEAEEIRNQHGQTVAYFTRPYDALSAGEQTAVRGAIGAREYFQQVANYRRASLSALPERPAKP